MMRVGDQMSMKMMSLRDRGQQLGFYSFFGVNWPVLCDFCSVAQLSDPSFHLFWLIHNM